MFHVQQIQIYQLPYDKHMVYLHSIQICKMHQSYYGMLILLLDSPHRTDLALLYRQRRMTYSYVSNYKEFMSYT